MRTQATLALIALLTSGAAAADGPWQTTGPSTARGPTAAALYLAVPIGVRGREQARPTWGLRVQELPVAPLGAAASPTGWRAKTILEVPLRARADDPVRDSGATLLLGKGLIVGIVVGAVVAVSVISDDDDGGGSY